MACVSMKKLAPFRRGVLRRLNNKTGLTAIVLFALFGSLLYGLSHAAGNATLTISPNTGSYNKNASFTVSIFEDSGIDTVNAVEVRLTYDQLKLQFDSLSNDTSPFSTCIEKTGGSGGVVISCAKLGGNTTGSQLVGKVSFKVLAGSGSTNISFDPNSHIIKTPENTDIWNGNTAGSTYTLTSPPPATKPSGGSTGQNTNTSNSNDATSSNTSSSSGATSSNSSSSGSISGNTKTQSDTSKTKIFPEQIPVTNLQNQQVQPSQLVASASEPHINRELVIISIVLLTIVGGGILIYSGFIRSRLSPDHIRNRFNHTKVKPTDVVEKPGYAETIAEIPYPKTPAPGSKVQPNSSDTLDVIEEKFASKAKKTKKN